MEIIRSLGRRKLRNGLTMSGILIGVLALTTLGALGAKLERLFDGAERFYGTRIIVTDASSTSLVGLLGTDVIEQVERVQGVAAAFPIISVPARPGDTRAVSFGPPATVTGAPGEYAAYMTMPLRVAQGRDLADGVAGEIVLGRDLARSLGVGVGERVTLPVPPADPRSLASFVPHDFRVVGILEPTLTAPDNTAYVGYADAQVLLADRLQPSILRTMGDKVATSIEVFGASGTDLDALARDITAAVPGVRALPPSELVEQFRSGSRIFSTLTFGSALLALVIGGLSIINTMTMSVSERVREIGLKKALGASPARVVAEHVAEAGAIGLAGGFAGAAMGTALAAAANASAGPDQVELFLVSPPLAISAVLFAAALSVLAGLLPAIRAARLDPVAALRSS